MSTTTMMTNQEKADFMRSALEHVPGVEEEVGFGPPLTLPGMEIRRP